MKRKMRGARTKANANGDAMRKAIVGYKGDVAAE